VDRRRHRPTDLPDLGAGRPDQPADDLTKFSFTKPETVKAFQWIHDIAWKHKVGAINAADMGGLSSQGDAFWAASSARCSGNALSSR